MSRGDYKIADGPYGIWVEKVERQNRVRLSREIRNAVSWLKNEPGTMDCVGTPGSAGGLQLETFEAHDTVRSGFLEALGDRPPTSSESAEQWVETARLLATTWRITITIESSRVSIPLPEPTRRALQLPGAGGMVVVFGFGEILEIWDAYKWLEHVRAVAKTKVSAISEAIEDLRQR